MLLFIEILGPISLLL